MAQALVKQRRDRRRDHRHADDRERVVPTTGVGWQLRPFTLRADTNGPAIVPLPLSERD